MNSDHSELLKVLKDSDIQHVEWRVFFNSDEADLDLIVATFSDGSRGPLPDEISDTKVHSSLWDLATDERLGNLDGSYINGLYILDVKERSVTRTAEVFYDFYGKMDDADALYEERRREYKERIWANCPPLWKRVFEHTAPEEEFDREAVEREIEQKIDPDSYFTVTPLPESQRYSIDLKS